MDWLVKSDQRVGVHAIPRINGWRQLVIWRSAAVGGALAFQINLPLYNSSTSYSTVDL